MALVNGQPLMWGALREELAEAAGGMVLEEVILQRLLTEELARRGMRITPEDVRAEREHLVRALQRGVVESADEAERLIAGVKRSRGLGERRFAALLERNAMLRALVAPEVEVEPADIEQAYQFEHGPRSLARVILTPTEREASRVRAELAKDPEHLRVRFAEKAARVSVDPSGPRGGVLDPISPVDPTYPEAVRRIVRTLRPGEMSPVVAVDRGFAILLLEEQIPPTGRPLAEVEGELREQVRIRKERLAMEDLATRLLREARITVLDRSTAWSWDLRRPTPP